MTTDFTSWLWKKKGEQAINNLEKHGFHAQLVPDKDTAFATIFELIKPYQSFGFGGSETARALGLRTALQKAGKTL